MIIDLLVAEIGSTTTTISALSFHPPYFLGRGMHLTTVDDNVVIGLQGASAALAAHLNLKALPDVPFYASSSAAGGLKITAHGLVYNMTATAAKEAAQSAGANVQFVSVNRLTQDDLDRIKAISPNIIVIAGGTDYGDKDVAYENLCQVLDLNIPIIYAGNIQNVERIKRLNHPLITVVSNVYPRVDDLNITPLRQAIYETFETHIVKAKGMQDVKKMVKNHIIPTPGSVMDATLLASQFLNNVAVIDVGGATTDVHSVTEPHADYRLFLEGSSKISRTVEGDLGVYVSKMETLKQVPITEIMKRTQLSEEQITNCLLHEPYIPNSYEGIALRDALTKICVHVALDRHIGDLKRVYTSNGIKMIPEGRDLTQVNAIILTGGALLHAKDAKQYVYEYLQKSTQKLAPKQDVTIYYDTLYLMSTIGVIAPDYPELAKHLLNVSLKEEK